MIVYDIRFLASLEMTAKKDREIFPTTEMLQNALGEVCSVLKQLETLLTQSELAFSLKWHFSCQTKKWHCKVFQGEKKIFWFSVEERHLIATFVFSEKDLDAISGLDINEQIKKVFFQIQPVRNKITASIIVYKTEQLTDLYKIIKLKTIKAI